MSSHELFTTSERIEAIEKEIRGVRSQWGITDFEFKVLESLKKLNFGSEKQLKILAAIEVKVFGRDRSLDHKFPKEPANQLTPVDKNKCMELTDDQAWVIKSNGNRIVHKPAELENLRLSKGDRHA